jgi:DNA-binding MarR family transcriptional regulator
LTLRELIKQDRFSSPSQEALLNLFATSSWAWSRVTAALAPYGITPAQYNVLRILRGVYPGHHKCSDVGARLVDRTPDVTRLLDRIEREGWVERRRSREDRRIVEVAITRAGLALLDQVDGPAERALVDLAEHLSPREIDTLIGLLEKLRTDQT